MLGTVGVGWGGGGGGTGYFFDVSYWALKKNAVKNK